MNKSTKIKILIFAVWIVLIGVLIGYGLTADHKPQNYAGEETLVSVTGGAVSEDGTEASEADGEALYDAASSGAAGNREPVRGDAGPGKSETKTGTKSSQKSPSPDEKTEKPSAHKTDSGDEAGSRREATDRPVATRAPTSRPEKKPDRPHFTFTIECKRIMKRPELWRDGLSEILPADGVFYSGTEEWKEGESVYDALCRICEANHILLDSRYTPLYDTYYVSGIGNLYEFDCGSESGWKYSVNGTLPGVGSSRYTIEKGDVIVFFYDDRI